MRGSEPRIGREDVSSTSFGSLEKRSVTFRVNFWVCFYTK